MQVHDIKPGIRRRRFMKLAALAPLGAAGYPVVDPSLSPATFPPSIPQGLVVLFQGDSITDAGRNRGQYYANDNSGLGTGYVYQITAQLLARYPENQLKCYNRGISGNKVHQLAARWEDDCLFLRPHILSLLIGVNDYWHTLTGNYAGTVQTFENDLRALLVRTRKQLPEIKILLGEPFAVKGGTALSESWEHQFPPYQQAVKALAAEFNGVLVPYQNVFDQALEQAPASHWCPDGVHPSAAGAFLMKEAWLQAFNKLW